MKVLLRQPLNEIIGLLLPDLCMLCNAPINEKGGYLCDQCWNGLPIFPDRTGQPLRPLRGVLNRLWIGWVYDDNLRRIVHFFKYHSRPEMADLLIRKWIMAISRPDEALDVDLLVPVPIHPARRRQRGFNQSERLADSIARHYNLPVEHEITVRIINTPSQTTLDRGQRWASVEGAFSVKNPGAIEGKRVLIVDDLATSGATLHSLGRTLQECKAGTISAAVLCSPDPEGQAI